MNGRINKTANKALMVAAILFLAACQTRDVNETVQNYQPVVSVVDSFAVIPGFGSGDSEGLRSVSPTSVSLTPSVSRLESGKGYQLQLKWEFTGPSPSWWTVVINSDRNDGTDVIDYEGEQTCPSDKRTFTYTMSPNRMYRFDLQAGINMKGQTQYKSVNVNLRGLF